MNLILFDTPRTHKKLLPLTFTKPIAELRCGILTIQEKWNILLKPTAFGYLTEAYLHVKYPLIGVSTSTLYVNGSLLPDEGLLYAIQALNEQQVLLQGHQILAFVSSAGHINYDNLEAIVAGFDKVTYEGKVSVIEYPWDIFGLNGQQIAFDFELVTKGRHSQPLSPTNTLIGPASKLFIEEGATVEASIINTRTGPVYIGKESEVMEGCVVRGPFALCEHSALKMAAKVYGPTTLGPHSKAGGELNNVVFQAYSNKAHDGFLGNSVIGEWCNLGADTNNSNLKNNYALVDVYSYEAGKQIDTGLQFCGLIMGDHAKCGINTMFNTGTVVGVFANIFGGDFPPKFIPSFSWGGAQWLRTFVFDKATEVAERVMQRRGITLTDADIAILKVVYEADAPKRK